MMHKTRKFESDSGFVAEVRARPVTEQAKRDPDYDAALDAYREGKERYRNTLRKLARS